MKFSPIGIGLIAFVCVLIIVLSLGQVAYQNCTLTRPTNDADRHYAVCIVRIP